MQITISSSELQKIPDALHKLVPTMDVTALQQLLQGVTFPVAGQLTLAVKLTPTDTLTVQINATVQ